MKTADEYMRYLFADNLTFSEKCAMCEYVEYDKDIKNMLCGADNFKKCRMIEMESEAESLDSCPMYKEVKID